MSAIFRVPQRGNRIPAQGNALGFRATPSPRSEGTPHTIGGPTIVRSPSMHRSFRTNGVFVSGSRGCTPGWYALPRWGTGSRGCTPGWYALPRWGTGVDWHALPRWGTGVGWYARPRWGKHLDNVVATQPQRGVRIPAQGNALGFGATPSPRSEGTPHTIGGATIVRSPSMRRSFRTDGVFVSGSQGCTPGWYTRPRWGTGVDWHALPRWGTEEGWYARPRWGQFPQLHLHLLPVGAKTSED